MSVDLFDDPDLDRVLASGLSALAPEVDAVDVTLAELRPRFHRARTRRRVVQASSAIAALLVVGSIAIAEAPSARRSHVTVESPVRRTESTYARNRTATSKRPHASTTTPKTLPASTKPAPASSAPATNAPVQAPIVVSPTAPPTVPVPARTPPTAPPATAPTSVVRSFVSNGGSITVRLSNRRLTLTDVRTSRGYHADVVARAPQLVDVRFTRNGREPSEIVVGIRNGRMVQVVGAGPSWTWRNLSAVTAPNHHKGLSQPTEKWAAGVPARGSSSGVDNGQGEA